MAHGIFDFTSDDLKANKKGRLTPHQQKWLQSLAAGVSESSTNMIYILLGFLGFGTLLFSLILIQNTKFRNALFSSSTNFIAVSVVVLAIVLILAISKFFAKKTVQQLTHAHILVAEGVIKFERQYSPESDILAYYVYVGKKRFPFSTLMHPVFQEKKKYKVYYCKAGAFEPILSFEKLS